VNQYGPGSSKTIFLDRASSIRLLRGTESFRILKLAPREETGARLGREPNMDDQERDNIALLVS
jgi:hypothetical protein